MDSSSTHPARIVIASGNHSRVQTMSMAQSFPSSSTLLSGFPVTIAAPSTSSGSNAPVQMILLDTSSHSSTSGTSGRANFVKMVSSGSKHSSASGSSVITLTPVSKSPAVVYSNQNGIRQAGPSANRAYTSSNLPKTIKVVASTSGSGQPRSRPVYGSAANNPKPIPLKLMKPRAPNPKVPKPSTSQAKKAPPPKSRQPIAKPVAKKKPVKRKRAKKRDNTRQDTYTAEMNDLRSKIQSRFDAKRKVQIKKEDVGYDGPYIKSYHLPETQGQMPVRNFIVDDLEAHVVPTGTNRHRLKLEKPTGMSGTDTVLTCAFCHLDPAAERETGMGDLIGPILVPAEVRWNRKPGEDKAYVYVHSRCLEWSSNFRMIGFELAEPRALFEDCKNTCDICARRGATIGCSGPRCVKAFHYPCAQLQGLKMIRDSHQIYCETHQNALMRKRKRSEKA
ncbi:uncharacterized protein LOC129581097 [Paramacrobiotus metropolitanus]|uniref:uncharacterized protein LOC129581097 n=1 Tax=Paramacrobiotus metropolitanus TaxID=2943436 RepID=UPI0024456703|nr:uncharacterized protein LOC129581097 [Paramacrobiotus metropolitanus]